jgi:predicted DNA-binding transcriptional regulator AlpA
MTYQPKLITVKQAAALLGVSEKWWRRRIAAEACPVKVYRLPGRHVRLDEIEIIDRLESIWAMPAYGGAR